MYSDNGTGTACSPRIVKYHMRSAVDAQQQAQDRAHRPVEDVDVMSRQECARTVVHRQIAAALGEPEGEEPDSGEQRHNQNRNDFRVPER